MWYKNIAGRFFGLVTKHACDRRTDRQNYDSQDRASIASRGNNHAKQKYKCAVYCSGDLSTSATEFLHNHRNQSDFYDGCASVTDVVSRAEKHEPLLRRVTIHPSSCDILAKSASRVSQTGVVFCSFTTLFPDVDSFGCRTEPQCAVSFSACDSDGQVL